MAATDKVKDAAGDATGKAKDAAGNGADKVTGSLRKEILSSFGDVLGPAIKEMSSQSAERLLAYAKEQGPAIFKEQALPKIMKSAGVDNPEDLAKAGVGKVGQMMAGGGGITGLAGKVMGKLGGKGGKKGVATGYGQGRRIMVQQHQYIPVDVQSVYRAWTTSEWPEYMHRVNTLDRQYGEEDGDESSYSIGVKGFWFKKNFTAQIQECKPYSYIVWSTTQGDIKNTGRVSFVEIGEDLTLMILNLDLAPSGLREKWVRGFRYHKRGIRSDFHRFAAWVQMRTPDELEDIEGWLGTVEGGKITQSHEEYLEEHEEEQDRGGDEGDEDKDDEPQAEADEDEEPEAESDQDDEDEPEEEPEDEDDGDDEPEAEADEADEDESEDDEENGYGEMRVAELRREARERGLSVRGSRGVLIDRLQRADDEDETDDEDEEDEPDEKPQRRRRSGRQTARR